MPTKLRQTGLSLDTAPMRSRKKKRSTKAKKKVLIVHEYPLRDGERKDLLNELFADAGLNPRRMAHVTHAVAERRPEGKNPTKSMLREGGEWLQEKIMETGATFVLLLGSVALEAACQTKGLKKLRGKPIEKDGINYFPVYSPGYVMRDERFMPVLAQDLKTFVQIVKRGGARKQEGLKVRIADDNASLQEALRDISRTSVVSFDCETSGLYPHTPGSWVASVGIGTGKFQWAIPLQHFKSRRYDKPQLQSRVVKRLAKVLEGKTVVAHNGKFDTKWLKVTFGVDVRVTFDTMLAHYNLDENALHGLSPLSQQYFGAIDYDIPLEEKHGLSGTLERHCEYLCLDVFYTRKLYFQFRKELKLESDSQWIFENITMPISHVYTDAELHGVYIDPGALEEAADYWRDKANTALKRLDKLCPSDQEYKDKKSGLMRRGVNWGSPDQVAEVLFDRLGLKVLEETAGGKRATSESVLLRLSNKHEVPQLILDYRGALKNLNTFILAWKAWCIDDRMHPVFKIHGTVTGRPSCEDPNLQQVPRDPRLRSLITAPPGKVLLDADFSQVELRVTAELSGDRELIYQYQTGGDVHTKTVQSIFGIASPSKEERKKGKAINFGFIYGMWWRKFKDYARDNYQQDFSDAESRRTREGFFKLYKDLPNWHKAQKAMAAKYGFVKNLLGRKRRLPDATRGDEDAKSREAGRQAINSPVQSFASDMNLMAAIEIHREIPHDQCMIVGTVHDSILMEVDEKNWYEIAKRVKAIMESPKLLRKRRVKLSVPIEAELEVGPWSKGEEIQFDKKTA